MTDEMKKRYLEQYVSADRHIDELLEEKAMWYDRALRVTPSLDNMPKASGHSNRTESAIENVAMLERQINNEIDMLCEMRRIISAAMERLEDSMQMRVIYLRYIRGMSFEQIGDKLGYCTKQIGRIHKQAISQLCFEKDYFQAAV